ncbi:hypothetical protein [Rhizobium phage RHph_X2_24]|nr:hypothetical protein [Rhizobium phage RHph_X2_24]
MFYLKLTINSQTFWATINKGSAPFGGHMLQITSDPLHAEAFQPVMVEAMRRLLITVYRPDDCVPVECSTRAIIPENMLRVLNLA